MSSIVPITPLPAVREAVATEARKGLLGSPRTLAPWLFYDDAGSALFERITELPEYYLTRTERGILEQHAEEILRELPPPLTLLELGAGTATKTGILLRAATRLQGKVLYQPIDVSASALEEARESIERELPRVVVEPQLCNYITDAIEVRRAAGTRVLALYIGSSIGNFSPEEGRGILRNLRSRLKAEDALLLGTDLAPHAGKPVELLLAAYDDRAGVTAAFNRNILRRLNRDLGADFCPEQFAHHAVWNAGESRMEMHLQSTGEQTVYIPANVAGPALRLRFAVGDCVHTENSYKFTERSIAELLQEGGFRLSRCWMDSHRRFAVSLARAA